MPQYTRFNYDGNRLWTTRGRRLQSEGLRAGLEYVLALSNRRVPIEEGTLERSGKVDVDGLDGSISYDTVYARRQHEELTWRHLPGRMAKFLEISMNESRQVVLEMMAVPLRRWLRG
ncbi:minor capsid protein [Streptomyces sp. NPDC057757]|uniref:minor capsid protein n=1 Tax=Streptomyces sp. NPDC057757 TaxID=3346241 RepID=UPI0036AC354F